MFPISQYNFHPITTWLMLLCLEHLDNNGFRFSVRRSGTRPGATALRSGGPSSQVRGLHELSGQGAPALRSGGSRALSTARNKGWSMTLAGLTSSNEASLASLVSRWSYCANVVTSCLSGRSGGNIPAVSTVTRRESTPPPLTCCWRRRHRANSERRQRRDAPPPPDLWPEEVLSSSGPPAPRVQLRLRSGDRPPGRGSLPDTPGREQGAEVTVGSVIIMLC